MRTKEDIESNIKLLESSLEGWKEELEFAENLRDKYFNNYDNSREDSVIADALTCYLSEINEQLSHAERVLDRERKKLQETNEK